MLPLERQASIKMTNHRSSVTCGFFPRRTPWSAGQGNTSILPVSPSRFSFVAVALIWTHFLHLENLCASRIHMLIPPFTRIIRINLMTSLPSTVTILHENCECPTELRIETIVWCVQTCTCSDFFAVPLCFFPSWMNFCVSTWEFSTTISDH
jgi:hypothetical protein